jgi:steroid delta-isomerase
MAGPSAEHIRTVFQRYVDLVSAGDYEATTELYAEDASVEDPVGSPAHVGHDAIRAFYKASAGSIRLALEGAVRTAGIEGACAMVARPKGADGVRIETLDTMVFDDDGRIASMRAYWSPDTIHQE